jgi:hypothetical protein
MDLTAGLAPELQPRAFTSATKALDRLLRLGPNFACYASGSPGRVALESYVGQQFLRAYDARVTEFLPDLLSMECQGSFSAAAGIRPARDAELFVERYLDDPVQDVLSELIGSRLSRYGIVEIGNLAATHRGATLLFFVIQAAILSAARYDWAIFAATRQVRKIVDKLQFVTFDLGTADPARLGPEAASWGSYYDTDPRVVVADVAATMQNLRRSALPAAVMAFFAKSIDDVALSLRTRSIQ